MKKSKDKIQRHKGYKIVITGLGVIATSTILTIAISCGRSSKTPDNTKEPIGDSEKQKIVDAIEQKQINEEIQKLFASNLDATATIAKATITNATVKIKDVTITFELGEADDNAKAIPYTITEIAFGSIKRAAKDLVNLAGTIIGFKTQKYLDAKLIVDGKMEQANQATTKANIETEIIKIFNNKDLSVAGAIAANNTREITIGSDIKVSFTTSVKSNEPSTLEFKVTKLVKDGYEFDGTNNGTQAELDKLNGEITGFKTQEYLDAKVLIDGKMEQASQATTQASIKAEIEKIFINNKDLSVSGAIVANSAREVTIAVGIKVTFTVNAKLNEPTTLEFKVTKLAKNGYEFNGINNGTQAALNALNNEIIGFKTIGYMNAKILINNKLKDQTSIDATKTSIVNKIDGLYNASEKDQKPSSVMQGKATIVDVSGIVVEFIPTANDAEGKISYTIQKLSKDGYELLKSDNLLGTNLNGEITGFKTAKYMAAKKLIDDKFKTPSVISATKQDIKVEIGKLFNLNQSVETNLYSITKREIMLSDGVKVKFIANKDNANNTILKFTITELSKDDYVYNDATELAKITDTAGITGFIRHDLQAAKILIDGKMNNAANQAATQADIKAEIEKIFNNKDLSVAGAMAANSKREVTIAVGIKVTFTVNEKPNEATTLEFKVTKLAKDGYEFDGINNGTQASLNAVGGEIINFKIKDGANKILVDSIKAFDIKTQIETLFTSPKNTKFASTWKTDLATTTTITLANGVIVTFAWANANDDNKTLNYSISKVEKGGQERSDLTGLDGTIDGFATKLELPTEMNMPIISGTSGTARDGVLVGSEADLANATHAFKWKVSASGTYATFSNGSDFVDGNWVQITWTTNDGYLFPNGSNTHTTAFEVKVYTAAQKTGAQTIREAIYTHTAANKIYIKNKITQALGNKNSQSAQNAIDALNSQEVLLANGIKANFNLKVAATDATNVEYEIVELSKDGYIYNIIANLTTFNDQVSGFRTVAFGNAKTLIEGKVTTNNKDVTKAAITTEIEKIFNNKDLTVAGAIAANNTREVTIIDNIKVEFYASPKNNNNTTLEFTVTKLAKDGFELTSGLAIVSGEILGFKSQSYFDAKVLIDAKMTSSNQNATKIAITDEIKKIFNNKNLTVAGVIAASNVREVTIGSSIKVIFTVNEKPNEVTTLEFKVTKLAKDGYEFNATTGSQGALDAVSGEIGGFKSAEYLAAKTLINDKMAQANQTTTKGLIQTAVEAKFSNKDQTIVDAITAAGTLEVTIADGVKVAFTVATKTSDATTLEFKVTKLLKDGYEFNATTGSQGALDAVSGEISGFKSAEYLAAKTLINNKMAQANQTTTKGLIQTAVEGKFVNKNQTVTSAITAAGILEVTLADGVKITFTAKAKTSDARILEFKATKLLKDGYEFNATIGTQAALDAVSGEVAGFKTQTEIDDQETVNNMSATNINDEIKKLFDTHLGKTATTAKAAVSGNTVLVNGATVTFTLGIPNDAAKKIPYTIVGIIKGGMSRDGNQLSVLAGEIIGFKTQTEIDAESNQDLANVSAADVKAKIETLFTSVSVKNGKLASQWKTDLAANTSLTLANDVKATVAWASVDDEKATLAYTITKLEKGSLTKNNPSNLNGTITGLAIGIKNPSEVNFPIIEFDRSDSSGTLFGKLVLAEMDIINATTKLQTRRKNSLDKTWYDFTPDLRLDIFTSEYQFKITWTTNNGYLFLNGKSEYAKEMDVKVYTTDEKLAIQEILKAVYENKDDTQAKINAKIATVLGDKNTQGAQEAKDTLATLGINKVTLDSGIEVTFTTTINMQVNTTINYQITKLEKKGYVYNTQTMLDPLKGEVAGFKTPAEADVINKAIVDRINQKQINDKIKALFTNLITKTSTQAKALLTTTTVRVDGATITFTLGNPDDIVGQLPYTINTITKGNVSRTGDLSGLGGDISGFSSQNDADKFAVEAVTNATIKTKIEALFTTAKSSKRPSEWKAILQAITTVDLGNGMIATFTWEAADNKVGTLAYNITKVTKGNQEKDDVSKLKGVISDFAKEIETPWWLYLPIFRIDYRNKMGLNDFFSYKLNPPSGVYYITYEIKNANGNYVPWKNLDPLKEGDWIKATWTIYSEKYFFPDGTQTASLEVEAKLMDEDMQLFISLVRDMLYYSSEKQATAITTVAQEVAKVVLDKNKTAQENIRLFKASNPAGLIAYPDQGIIKDIQIIVDLEVDPNDSTVIKYSVKDFISNKNPKYTYENPKNDPDLYKVLSGTLTGFK